MADVWEILEKEVNFDFENPNIDKQKSSQTYSNVAESYHLYRQKYPGELIDQAIKDSPLLSENKDASILEIGCGPGTATLPFLQRGFRMTCLEPGVGMYEKVQEVCSGFEHVTFHCTTFADFETNEQYDAILAATSIHWALIGPDKEKLVEKLHRLLKPGGTLILLWNFPSEPSAEVRDAIAKDLNAANPFYFGKRDVDGHYERMKEVVFDPIISSGLFTPFSKTEIAVASSTTIEGYFGYCQTMSHFIKMPDDKKERLFNSAKKIINSISGDNVDLSGKSMLNISFRK